MLDPHEKTRISIADVSQHEWMKQDMATEQEV